MDSLRIEKAFTKDRILELYLNQIYLGAGNYGVAAAALNYFNKSLDELSVAEAAYRGGLASDARPADLEAHGYAVVSALLAAHECAAPAATKVTPLVNPGLFPSIVRLLMVTL